MEREEGSGAEPWLEYISDLSMKLSRTLSKDPLKKIRKEDQTAGTGPGCIGGERRARGGEGKQGPRAGRRCSDDSRLAWTPWSWSGTRTDISTSVSSSQEDGGVLEFDYMGAV